MTSFWITCAVLLLVALPFLVLPLWRSTGKNNDVLRDAANLEILRDQSAELEADLRNGLLTQEAYDQGKHELQARLLEEVKTTGQPAKPPRNPAKVLAVVLAVLLPLVSVPLYLKLGNVNAIVIANGGSAGMSMEAMLRELERKVEQQPENPNHLVMLARTYAGLKRYPEAVQSYQQLVKLVPGEAQVWTEYAEALAMSSGRTLQGEPTMLINKALELDGNNLSALGLSGSAAMESGDYAKAIIQWQKLLSLLPPDNQYIENLRKDIQQARDLLAQQPGGKEQLAKLPADKAPETPAVNVAAAITGKITISAELAGKVLPTDTIYVLARAAEGPRMPLAVLRRSAMAMQQEFKLSNFDQVVVVARVSKSGTPMAQAGDLEGKVTTKPGSKDLNIVIDTVVQ